MANNIGHHEDRVLAIALTTDESDDDIESIDSVTFYRTFDDYQRSENGYSPLVKIGSSGLPSGYSSAVAASIGAATVGIKFGEIIPTPSVIFLTLTASQA